MLAKFKSSLLSALLLLLFLSLGSVFPPFFSLPSSFIVCVIIFLYLFCTKSLSFRLHLNSFLYYFIFILFLGFCFLNGAFDRVLAFRILSPIVYLSLFQFLFNSHFKHRLKPINLHMYLCLLSLLLALISFLALILGPSFTDMLNSVYTSGEGDSVRLDSFANGRFLTTFHQPLEAGTFSLMLFISLYTVIRSRTSTLAPAVCYFSLFCSTIPGIIAFSKVAILGIPLYLSLLNIKAIFIVFYNLYHKLAVTKMTLLVFSFIIGIVILFSTLFLRYWLIIVSMFSTLFVGRYYQSISGVETSMLYFQNLTFHSLFFGRSYDLLTAALDSEFIFIFFISGILGLLLYLYLILAIPGIISLTSKRFKFSYSYSRLSFFVVIVATGLGSFMFFNPRTCPITCLAFILVQGSITRENNSNDRIDSINIIN